MRTVRVSPLYVGEEKLDVRQAVPELATAWRHREI